MIMIDIIDDTYKVKEVIRNSTVAMLNTKIASKYVRLKKINKLLEGY